MSGRTFFHGLSKHGLYPFHSHSLPSSNNGYIAFLGECTSAAIWHRRLGHPSSSIFQHILPNLPLSGSISFPFCEFCSYAKSCKLSFGKSTIVTTFPLQLIHCDVWGPSPILSMSGFKFYVVFADIFLSTLGSFHYILKLMCLMCFLHSNYR